MGHSWAPCHPKWINLIATKLCNSTCCICAISLQLNWSKNDTESNFFWPCGPHVTPLGVFMTDFLGPGVVCYGPCGRPWSLSWASCHPKWINLIATKLCNSTRCICAISLQLNWSKNDIESNFLWPCGPHVTPLGLQWDIFGRLGVLSCAF